MSLSLLPPLSSQEQDALRTLVSRLVSDHGEQIVDLILFGSKARGEGTPESDIDVLVIVTQEQWRLRSTLSRLGARVSLECAVLFNLHIVSRVRWQWMQSIGHPLWRNIQAEGIPLLSTPVSSS